MDDRPLIAVRGCDDCSAEPGECRSAGCPRLRRREVLPGHGDGLAAELEQARAERDREHQAAEGWARHLERRERAHRKTRQRLGELTAQLEQAQTEIKALEHDADELGDLLADAVRQHDATRAELLDERVRATLLETERDQARGDLAAARAVLERVRAAVDELVSPADLVILRVALDGDGGVRAWTTLPGHVASAPTGAEVMRSALSDQLRRMQAERDEARATIARVQALAARWDADSAVWGTRAAWAAAALQEALDGPSGAGPELARPGPAPSGVGEDSGQPAMLYHVGRAWSGHAIEDACPRPQEPCGLVDEQRADPAPGRMPRRRRQPRDLGPPIHSDEPAYFCLPDPEPEPDVWEYATTTGPRKAWADADVPPEGEGWERDVDAAPGGWDRDDYHETSFWRRRVPGGPAEAGEGEVRDA